VVINPLDSKICVYYLCELSSCNLTYCSLLRNAEGPETFIWGMMHCHGRNVIGPVTFKRIIINCDFLAKCSGWLKQCVWVIGSSYSIKWTMELYRWLTDIENLFKQVAMRTSAIAHESDILVVVICTGSYEYW
jgi:hypothetical protein